MHPEGPSPTKLKPSTVKRINMPAGIHINQKLVITKASEATLMMLPQEAQRVFDTQTQENQALPPAMMIPPSPAVACTINSGMTLGTRCLKILRLVRMPVASVATMKSCSRSEKDLSADDTRDARPSLTNPERSSTGRFSPLDPLPACP